MFLGEWHQTAVAVKLLLRGGGQAAAGIGSLGDARQALSLPPQVLQKLDEVRRGIASFCFDKWFCGMRGRSLPEQVMQTTR